MELSPREVVEMKSWVQLVETDVASSEFDTDEINFGVLPQEQAAATEASPTLKTPEEQAAATEASPPLKTANKNKKRTRNFSEKEDVLLASAWLEVSMDPVQSIDQTRSTYWQRIHDHYHKHKKIDSDHNVSSLSHRWGIIQASVSRFCSAYSQVLRSNQSGVTEQDKIQQSCTVYKDADPEKKSFVLLHCWNLLQHVQKWKDLPTSSSNKKQKTSSRHTPGTHESRHADEEDGPSQTSPSKEVKPKGQKREKESRGKNPIAHGETLYMEAVEYSWSKREKADELKELRKKERNEERLAIENKRIRMKQEVETRKLDIKEQVENRRLDLQQQEMLLKQRMDDGKIMNMDLSTMSELQREFYSGLQKEIIARRLGNGKI